MEAGTLIYEDTKCYKETDLSLLRSTAIGVIMLSTLLWAPLQRIV